MHAAARSAARKDLNMNCLLIRNRRRQTAAQLVANQVEGGSSSGCCSADGGAWVFCRR
jgi:hypothetical protein